MEENMNEREARRLYAWLRRNGHTEEEADDAVTYTVGAKEIGREKMAEDERGSQTPDK